MSLIEAVEKVLMFVYNAKEKGCDVSSAKLRPVDELSSCLELEAGWLVLSRGLAKRLGVKLEIFSC